MAAGSGAASGQSRGSAAVLESSLDRRFQGVTNTMESIQGLSTWCIENKKHHSIIVRHWIKRLRKSDSSHRLNLFYLANDVIQNCKRKNAIVYRTTFTDVLPEAVKLINSSKDSQVCKSVDRILSIWEERNVYSEELISQLRGSLIQKEEPPAPVQTVNPKAALRSKIVAEFVPSAFIEQLTKYRKSIDETELKEKQLAAMRVDVCSTTALKKLKDKAGGKRFSKDFEDGSKKLQDFVAYLDGEVKKGPPLMEALENADIFYEMQYKEVKIITKAYQTFANRVLHLKRKLDALKSAVPDPNESPVPSPLEDAPSPTGSESPFHDLPQIGTPDPELDGQAMEEDLIALGDAPSPLSSIGEKDNRDVEDMELSDMEETEGPAIIVEEKVEQPSPVSILSETPAVAVTVPSQPSQAAPVKQVTAPAPAPVQAAVPAPAPVQAAVPAPVQAATPTATVTPTTPSLPINLAGVDLSKISSILSTLTNVMKNSGVSPASRSSTTTLNTPSTASSAPKTPTTPAPAAAPAASPLASILSRVDFNPSTLLSALSKTQAQGIGLQGLSSLLNNQTGITTTPSGQGDGPITMDPSPDPTNVLHSQASPKTTVSSAPPPARVSTPQRAELAQSSQSPNIIQTRDLQKEVEPEPVTSVSSSLDSKIDSFLQGNSVLKGLNMGFPSVLPWPKGVDSPSTSTDNLGGTPVRDESGATPTQDEVMDDPVVQPPSYQGGPREAASATSALASSSAPPVTSEMPMATYSDLWKEQNKHGSQFGFRSQNGGQLYDRKDFQISEPSLTQAGTGRHQHVEPLLQSSLANSSQMSNENVNMDRTGSVNQGATAYSITGKARDDAGAGLADGGWYRESYRGGLEQPVAHSEGYGREQFPSEEPRKDLSSSSDFFKALLPPLPPIPQLPPPPTEFLPPVEGASKDSVEHPDPVDKTQPGDMHPYVSPNPVGYEDYDERQSHPFPPKEPLNPHLNMSGPRLRGPAPRMAPPDPRTGHVDYNNRMGVPQRLPHPPNMIQNRPRPPNLRGFPETSSAPQAPSEEPYIEPYNNPVHHNPSSHPFHGEHPLSPQSHDYYPEDRDIPPRHPEHRPAPSLEHRPPAPFPYRGPRPGPFPPQRPLRRPPPPHMPFPGELPFQRGKRHGPPFAGGPRAGGMFYPPKRPFLPPRY
ncbi:regulation of nuclear pre-mRNA domain-containing protein 2a [Astyanax mexicanus]|uniref:regulation of nuclear pre-mRNA domain-containing protein 2a n=1 Tax=Astyanax mexicanus TaxID=7994 RepID=UPI0020CAAD63|nr:regulation of nuclear pre-mRNA domain-containing protein 2a [Astyanax mexicanus]